MGYYILGIIIFLLLIVFISDLIRQAKDSDNKEFDNDEFYNRLSSQYPGTFSYREEFSEEYIDRELESEEGKTNDMGVEPIYQNVEQQAFEHRINEADKELQDVLPEDQDENNPKH